MRRTILMLLTVGVSVSFYFWFSDYAVASPVENRYCVVRSTSDSSTTYHSLRNKIENGFNRDAGSSVRYCTEGIYGDKGAEGSIELKSTLKIDNPDDLDQDGDGWGLVIDFSKTLNTEIHAESLGEKCAILVNANNVKLTGFSLYVDKVENGICKSSEELNIDDSGVKVIATDDPDGDRVPSEKDNCPEKFNPDQADMDGDHFGDACDNCPAYENADQDPDACKPKPTESAVPTESPIAETPSPLPSASPSPKPTATPMPTSTPEATTSPDPTGAPTETPIVVPPVDPNDKDGDGISNDSDNCPLLANPGQENSDDDALGDACDPNPSVSDSLSDDTVVNLNSGAAGSCSLLRGIDYEQSLGFLLFLVPTMFGWISMRQKNTAIREDEDL